MIYTIFIAALALRRDRPCPRSPAAVALEVGHSRADGRVPDGDDEDGGGGGGDDNACHHSDNDQKNENTNNTNRVRGEDD